MTPDEWEKAVAAERAWVAAKGHKLAAEAVLYVWNRQVQDGGKRWPEVFYAYDVCGPDPDSRDPEFQYVLQLVDLIYANQRRDRLTNNATNFGSAVPEGCIETSRIGSLVFWKEDGSATA